MKISHLLLGWSLFCAFFDPFQQFAKSKNLLKPQQKNIPSTRSLHYLFRVQQKLVPGQLNDSRELVEKRCKFWAENEITIKARFNWGSKFICFFFMEGSVYFPYTSGWCRTVLGVLPPPALTCGGSKAPPVREGAFEKVTKSVTQLIHSFLDVRTMLKDLWQSMDKVCLIEVECVRKEFQGERCSHSFSQTLSLVLYKQSQSQVSQNSSLSTLRLKRLWRWSCNQKD